jgi:hypothetical protein
MTDWKALSHAYGEASAIPGLIDRLREGHDEKAWDDLWSCLCHQGTVYSASYAALQPLCELARTLPPDSRLMALVLIGQIIASDDLFGIHHRPIELIAPLIPALRELVDESMKVEGLESKEFIYCLEAAAAFAGDLFWGRQLDHLVGGDFSGCCPSCGHDLRLVIGDRGFFVTAQKWGRPENASATRNPISPADEGGLAANGAWLHSKALSHGHEGVALSIRHVFGTGTCPQCQNTFKVADAIALRLPSRQPTEG